MNQLHDQRIIDQEILLEDKSIMNCLGPNLHLERCIIDIKVSAGALIVADAKLIDCIIRLRMKFSNFRWLNANFDGCTFYGTLSGCDFGHSPEIFHSDAGIRNCDFTHTTLDGCRFIDSDISSLQFPGWPHFIIVSPHQNVNAIKSVKWPTETWMNTWVKIMTRSPETTSAIVEYTPSLLKEIGGAEDDLRSALISLKQLAPNSVVFD